MKGLFQELKVDFTAVELDEVGMISTMILCAVSFNTVHADILLSQAFGHAVEGEQVQDALLSITKSRTVPQVFIKGEFIGGCDGASNTCAFTFHTLSGCL